MLSILVMCSIDMEKYADLVGRGYLIELREVKEKRKKFWKRSTALSSCGGAECGRGMGTEQIRSSARSSAIPPFWHMLSTSIQPDNVFYRGDNFNSFGRNHFVWM